MAKKAPNKTARGRPSAQKTTNTRKVDTKAIRSKQGEKTGGGVPAVIAGQHDTFATLQKKTAMLEAMKFHYGIIAPSAEQVGISRKTHYRWMESDPGYKEEVEAIIERTYDFVESKMVQRINEGSDTMLIWYSKTKMKSRGFVERSEIEVTNTPAFVVKEEQKGVSKVMDIIHKKTGTNNK